MKLKQDPDSFEIRLGNINTSKVDYAYDIDPLFHKMSQQFDEGGAKGLLLVNLGVANDGCRLVLDSREDNVAEFAIDPDPVFNIDINTLDGSNILDTSCVIENSTRGDDSDSCPYYVPRHEGKIDISQLRDKLQELILVAPLESVDLVPQLKELRSEYNSLRLLGFTDSVDSQAKVSCIVTLHVHILNTPDYILIQNRPIDTQMTMTKRKQPSLRFKRMRWRRLEAP